MNGNRIDEVRLAQDMTWEELAERAGFSVPYVWQMANGVRNISLKNLAKIARALQCSPEDLLEANTTNNDLLNVWAAIPVDRRELALRLLEQFSRQPTGPIDNPPRATDAGESAKAKKPGRTTRRQKRNPK